MSLDFKFNSASGLGLRSTLNQDSTDRYWVNGSGWVSPGLTFLSRSMGLMVGTGEKTGSYSGVYTGMSTESGVTLFIHDTGNSNSVLGQQTFYIISGSPALNYDLAGKVLGGGTTNFYSTGVAVDVPDVFYWDLDFAVDESGAKNEYTVQLFKNGGPFLDSVTGVRLQVIRRSDATDLVPSSGMSQIGSFAAFKLDVSGSYLMTRGESYLVYTSGYAENGVRQFMNIISRDYPSG